MMKVGISVGINRLQSNGEKGSITHLWSVSTPATQCRYRMAVQTNERNMSESIGLARSVHMCMCCALHSDVRCIVSLRDGDRRMHYTGDVVTEH